MNGIKVVVLVIASSLCNNISMQARQIVIFAPCMALLSCGEAPSPHAESYWRPSVEGSPECLAQLTRAMERKGIAVARFPEWNDGSGIMDFGPVATGAIGDLRTIIRASGCATLRGKQSSCSGDYSDVAVC
jgi:hypothetical protein